MERLQVARVERRQNTASGNPRWRVHLDDGRVLDTEPDAAIGHRIDTWFESGPVDVTLNDEGRVVGWEPVDPVF